MALIDSSPNPYVRPRTPNHPAAVMTPPATPPKSRSLPNSPRPGTARKSGHGNWSPERIRRAYLEHLESWSLNHDASVHFHGTLSIPKDVSADTLQLGHSVRCILANTSWSCARKHIIVRLFAPRPGKEQYRLVVRCGAGWMSARDFFDKEHIAYQVSRRGQNPTYRSDMDTMLSRRSEMLGLQPSDKDTLTVRPLFHPFLRLPIELQQQVLAFVVNATSIFRPSVSKGQGFSMFLPRRKHQKPTQDIGSRSLQFVDSPTQLGTIFRICKVIREHLTPWIFRTTAFHFGDQGMTNFLWLAGPERRPLIKQVTLAFGRYALVHTARWFAPDPVFKLFDPKMALSPPAMQSFWRCQVRDLVATLHLSALTVDVRHVPREDIPFVVSALLLCFGDVDSTRFTHGAHVLQVDDPRLEGLQGSKSWAGLCRDAFDRYRNVQCHDQAFSDKRKACTMEDLNTEMDKDKNFFGQTWTFGSKM